MFNCRFWLMVVVRLFVVVAVLFILTDLTKMIWGIPPDGIATIVTGMVWPLLFIKWICFGRGGYDKLFRDIP